MPYACRLAGSTSIALRSTARPSAGRGPPRRCAPRACSTPALSGVFASRASTRARAAGACSPRGPPPRAPSARRAGSASSSLRPLEAPSGRRAVALAPAAAAPSARRTGAESGNCSMSAFISASARVELALAPSGSAPGRGAPRGCWARSAPPAPPSARTPARPPRRSSSRASCTCAGTARGLIRSTSLYAFTASSVSSRAAWIGAQQVVRLRRPRVRLDRRLQLRKRVVDLVLREEEPRLGTSACDVLRLLGEHLVDGLVPLGPSGPAQYWMAAMRMRAAGRARPRWSAARSTLRASAARFVAR